MAACIFCCQITANGRDVVAVVKMLLENSADAGRTEYKGHTALHLLGAFGKDSVYYTSSKKKGVVIDFASAQRGVVDALVVAGCGVDVRGGLGETALHVAAMNGDVGVMRVLLEYGADFEARNGDGRTPLHLAACCRDGRRAAEAVRVLLERGSKADVRGAEGVTPRGRAEERRRWGGKEGGAYRLVMWILEDCEKRARRRGRREGEGGEEGGEEGDSESYRTRPRVGTKG